jgi:hypothetical protein
MKPPSGYQAFVPSVRLGDFHPPYRLRLIASPEQPFSNDWPVLFQIVIQLTDSHPIDSGATFVGLYPPQCFRFPRSHTSSIKRFV